MIEIEIQNVSVEKKIPSTKLLKQWVKSALETYATDGSLTLRIVDKDEMLNLNREYRGKAKPTNVLAFPFSHDDNEIMGDIIVCASVVAEEALAQHKVLEEHWAHLVIHGALHLAGFDHIKEEEALVMEGLEVEILAKLGIHNPYSF